MESQMNTETWLPLLDYSSKYKISMSTLRRRIKAEDIKFKFDDGKYLISDEPLGAHQRIHRPSLKSDGSLMGTPAAKLNSAANSDYSTKRFHASAFDSGNFGLGTVQQTPTSSAKFEFNPGVLGAATSTLGGSPSAAHLFVQSKPNPAEKKESVDENVLSVANRLLNELKKAYMQILQEKEEQILLLKDEVADLKTLVRVLEDENQRKQK
jgi:hypothetical protein